MVIYVCKYSMTINVVLYGLWSISYHKWHFRINRSDENCRKFCVCFRILSSYTEATQVDDLIANILTNCSRHVRPVVDPMTQVNVLVILSVYQLNDVDLVHQVSERKPVELENTTFILKSLTCGLTFKKEPATKLFCPIIP